MPWWYRESPNFFNGCFKWLWPNPRHTPIYVVSKKNNQPKKPMLSKPCRNFYHPKKATLAPHHRAKRRGAIVLMQVESFLVVDSFGRMGSCGLGFHYHIFCRPFQKKGPIWKGNNSKRFRITRVRKPVTSPDDPTVVAFGFLFFTS